MQNNHLTYFKVENFKKFDSLEVNDIGQFNLIVGDNNVGKTCLLEALLVDEDTDKTIENIHHSLCKRVIHIHPHNIHSKNPTLPTQNYFKFLKNNLKVNKISFNWEVLDKSFNYKLEDKILEDLSDEDFEKELKHNYNIGRPELWVKIYKNDVFEELQFMYLDDFKTKFDHGYQPFISKDAGFNVDLNNYYAEGIGLTDVESITNYDIEKTISLKIKSLSFEDKQDFIKNLSLFFVGIEDVMMKNYNDRIDILSIKLKQNSDYVPITYFGDGTNEFIRYILEIPRCRDNRIMIDEIATGIHYHKLIEFWKKIILICKNSNVQLFTSTHSRECIDAFCLALEELGFSEQGKVILLQEEKEKIVSYTFETKNLDLAFDYRG